MAKRAPLLPQDYNPVGARLKQALIPPPEEESSRPEVQAQLPEMQPVQAPPSQKVVTAPQFQRPRPEPQRQESRGTVEVKREVVIDEPRTKEMMATSLRCRCTENERKKWHDFAKNVTGEHNQFSHVFRSMLLLLENSDEQLIKLLPEMKQLKVPAKKDSMAIALYEQKLSQILWDAIKAAGRPRG
jgi:hypothetical protein